MNMKSFNVVMILTLSFYSLLYAHRPIFTDEKGIDSETAVVINQPDVSQVIYRELSDETQRLWLSIDAKKKFNLYVQIGVPVIDRLKFFRPAFAVVGPDMQEISLPFSIPEGIGGEKYTTGNVKPRFFHEHFTKTDSWILRSETITLPSDGTYYVVAYSPYKLGGKFWLSVGKKEKFEMLDLLSFGAWKKTIQKFHETGLDTSKSLTIDDFSDPNRISTLGTSWRLVTDRVMGGVSEGEFLFGNDECFRYLKMKGNVSLENNGGLVQVALPLNIDSKSLDATNFAGIRFWAKGNNEQYYVHLRNDQTNSPWQYYSAAFKASEKWEQIYLPFDQFMPQAINDKLKLDKLSQISIVGANKAYKVDVYLGPVELYSKLPEKKLSE